MLVFWTLVLLCFIALSDGSAREFSRTSKIPASRGWYPRFLHYLELAEEQYGQGLSQECNNTFGLGMLRSWQGQPKRVLCGSCCGSSCSINSASAGSSVTVQTHMIDTTKWIAAVSHNVVATEPLGFLGTPGGLNKPDWNDDWPNPKPGSLLAQCTMCQQEQAEVTQDGHMQTVFKTAMSASPSADVSTACNGTVQHPVFWAIRQDVVNAFHHMEDVTNAIMTIAASHTDDMAEQGVQMVLADWRPHVAFDEFWRRLSFPHPVRRLRTDPFPANTCLRQVIVARQSDRSLLTQLGAGRSLQCRSTLLIAISHLLRSLFAEVVGRPELVHPEKFLPHPTPPPPPPHSSITQPDGTPFVPHGERHLSKGRLPRIVTKYVTWVSRRHFEASFDWGLSGWQKSRLFGNEDELVMGLHKAILEWNAQACFWKGSSSSRRLLLVNGMPAEEAERVLAMADGGRSGRTGRQLLEERKDCRNSPVTFRYQDMELSDVPFPQHLSRLSRTSVFVSSHGCGLTNMIFMKPGTAGVVELQHASAGNFHYHNLAYHLDLRYRAVMSAGQNADVRSLVQAVKEVMDEVANL